jgi:copper chaperone CopZ
MISHEAVLSIRGMSCGDCARNVAEWLLGVEGVADVEVRVEENRARVELDEHEPPTEADLIKAVHAAGYDVERIEIVD